MTAGEPVQRVRIYINERDTHEGRALYLAVMERLRREGATGATALRGVAGFGAGHRVRAGGLVDISDTQPVVIDWVDRAERVARVMPMVEDLLQEAFVTIEELRAYRAALRSSGPFGGQTAGEVMLHTVVTGTPAMPIRDAVRLMLEASQPVLPVLDEQKRVLGLLTSEDLERRGGMVLPLRLVAALTRDEQAALVGVMREQPLSDVIVQDPRTVYIQSSIPQMVGTLIEWGLQILPVIDRNGQFAGLIGVEQALQTALTPQRSSDSAIRDAEPSPPVRLLMQTSVPSVPASAPVATALRQLLAAPERFLIIVDQGRPAGVLSDEQLLKQLQSPLRDEWLTALRFVGTPPAFASAPDQLTTSMLAQSPPLISELATQDDAIRMMLENGHERLVAINDEGLLTGLLGRRALLRALAQASQA